MCLEVRNFNLNHIETDRKTACNTIIECLLYEIAPKLSDDLTEPKDIFLSFSQYLRKIKDEAYKEVHNIIESYCKDKISKNAGNAGKADMWKCLECK